MLIPSARIIIPRAQSGWSTMATGRAWTALYAAVADTINLSGMCRVSDVTHYQGTGQPAVTSAVLLVLTHVPPLSRHARRAGDR